jgi:hypothetical protein
MMARLTARTMRDLYRRLIPGCRASTGIANSGGRPPFPESTSHGVDWVSIRKSDLGLTRGRRILSDAGGLGLPVTVVQEALLADRYLMAEVVGSGGMGTVYRATDLRTGGPVAVKVLHPHLAANADFVRRLRQEAMISASLTSPRVVRVTDLGVDHGNPFLVMEFVPGPTLDDRLRELSVRRRRWRS